MVEPALPGALARLSKEQRASVMLVHGYGWTVRDAAEMLGLAPSTVQRNADRALSALRTALGANSDS
jgi:DNA-directed RNA polymerase specialized sigma24 family protein